MSTMVNGYSAAISTGIGPARTDSSSSSSTGDTAGRTRQAAAALGQYMQQRGIDTVTPNQLSQLARNTPGDTPGNVSDAASFLLRNPDVYALLETHDVPGRDGISGASNLGFAARGGYDAQLQDSAPASAPAVTEQDARSAIAAFRQQNPAASIDPNTLYQLAMRPNSDTAPATSAAAKFLLKNPDVLDKINAPASDASTTTAPAPANTATTDSIAPATTSTPTPAVAITPAAAITPSPAPAVTPAASAPKGPEQSAMQQPLGVAAPKPAAADGTPTSGTQALDGQRAARILADHMLHGAGGASGASGVSGIGSTSAGTAAPPAPSVMTVDQLYRLAEGGKAPPEVAAAAKFMLQNPDIYRAIETHDVPGADGKSAVGNLQAAARGEVPGVRGKASSATKNILQLLQLLVQALRGTSGSAGAAGASQSPSTASAAAPAAAVPATTPTAAQPLDARSEVPGVGGAASSSTSNLLQQLKVLQQLLQIVSQLFKTAAASPANQPLDGQSAARVLADHMIAEAGGARGLLGQNAPLSIPPLTPDRLYQLAQGQGPVAAAAKFMLQNPDVYRAIETHDVAGADGISGVGNLLAAARGEVPGVTGKADQAPQQLQQLLQVLRALLPLLQATSGAQAPQGNQASQGPTPDRSTGNRSVLDVLQQLLQVLKGSQGSPRSQSPAQPLDGQHAASILADYMMQTRRQALTRDPMSSVRDLLGQAAEGMQIFEQQNRMMQIGLQMRLLQLSTTVA